MDVPVRCRIARGGLRSLAILIAGAAVSVAPATALSAISSAAAAAPKLPDPCALAPARLVASALGVKVATKGTLSAATVDKVTEDKCTWVHGKITLFVAVEPYQPSGGFGGPPGTVIEHKPAGLGSDGVFAYDTNPKYLYSDATFAKGAYSADVHSNGPDTPSSVLTLARAVYSGIK